MQELNSLKKDSEMQLWNFHSSNFLKPFYIVIVQMTYRLL